MLPGVSLLQEESPVNRLLCRHYRLLHDKGRAEGGADQRVCRVIVIGGCVKKSILRGYKKSIPLYADMGVLPVFLIRV